MKQQQLNRILNQLPGLYEHMGVTENDLLNAEITNRISVNNVVITVKCPWGSNAPQCTIRMTFDNIGVLQKLSCEFEAHDELGLETAGDRPLVNLFRRRFDAPKAER